jgi:hypothetical protein
MSSKLNAKAVHNLLEKNHDNKHIFNIGRSASCLPDVQIKTI